ncbi:MAG: chorismate mutase [Gemmatimonadetes bacterium]|nr:chorismate mutase [Gemmatimonadota bacterium]NNL31524.1 chorismate mutase [Gemmatimonadota bacterium]
MSESPGDSKQPHPAYGEALGAAPDARLDRLRAEIRAVDEELITLVGRRRDLVLAIGEAKAELGLPVLDPSQEARVVRRAAELARDLGVDEELTRDVIWRIMASARDAQEGRTRWGPPLSERAGQDEG